MSNESVFDIKEGMNIFTIEILEETSFFSKVEGIKFADKMLNSSNSEKYSINDDFPCDEVLLDISVSKPSTKLSSKEKVMTVLQ
jgi:hypothetical protein